MSSTIVGDNNEFELTREAKGLKNFVFKVLDNGIDTGDLVRVNIYGGISLPYNSKISLSREDRNKLSSFAINEYKKGMYF